MEARIDEEIARLTAADGENSRKRIEAIEQAGAEAERQRQTLEAQHRVTVAEFARLVTASEHLLDALSQQTLEAKHFRALAACLPARAGLARELRITKRVAANVPQPPARKDSADAPAPAPVPAAKKPLQFSGPARDATRVRMRRDIEVDVDGIPGELVDLSVGGAQTLLRNAVRPNQLVRLAVRSASTPLLCKGRVVWVTFEHSSTSMGMFRAGIRFTDIDVADVERFMVDFCDKPTLVKDTRSSNAG